MYVTHGDTIVIRSDRPGRFGTSSRLRPHGDWGDGRRDPSPGRHGWAPEHPSGRAGVEGGERLESLRQRVEVLEDRVSRLEARLARAAEAGSLSWRTDGYRSDGHRSDGYRADGKHGDGRWYGRNRSGEPGVPDYGSGRPGGGRSSGGESRQVRVTLQAAGGAHVSVGEARLIQHR